MTPFGRPSGAAIPQPVPTAFTIRHDVRVLRLITQVQVFPAFRLSDKPTQGKLYQALYDKGATHSAISPRVVEELQLSSIGARNVGVGGGFLTTTGHLVNFGLPNRVMFGMLPVAKLIVPGGVDVVVGMDILGNGDFSVTHHNGKTTFSFCYPSLKEIDFVAEVEESQRIKQVIGGQKPGRNDLCPCGSGKKYKKCHGGPQ